MWHPLNRQIPKDLPSTTPVTSTSAQTITTKPITSLTSAQVSPVVAMGTGHKQIGLLTSVGGNCDKTQEKPTTGLSTNVTGTGMIVAAAVSSSTGTSCHLAEVCAVQGPPRQLTSSSPSPSPTSTTSSSSSPRPSSVNSINFINNLAHQDGATKLSQSPATTQICTPPTASYCNTGDGQQQTSAPQQRCSPASTHIAISTSNLSNSVIPATAASAGTIVVAGTVRQLSSVDHQIRVLTPSEIMRTLPSLSQEHYDPPSTAIIHTVPVQTPAMVSHLIMCL